MLPRESRTLAGISCLAAVLFALGGTSTAAGAPYDTSDLPAAELPQSVGLPRRGHLERGDRLGPGPTHVFRNGATTYGTTSTVGHLRAILNRLEAWPLPHRLVIGDLSTRGGGPLLGHRSHQTGRDVDIGFFYRRSPGRKFVEATPDGLDLPSTFALLAALAETQADPSGVQWILLDYRIQHQLYAWAQGQGIDPSTLDRWFQYPHGKRADRGLIRHYPNHRHHMHVRFGCGHEDKACVSPPGPPT